MTVAALFWTHFVITAIIHHHISDREVGYGYLQYFSYYTKCRSITVTYLFDVTRV